MDSSVAIAKDPLDSVISNVPDWLKRLEELNGQIEQRQQELAKFATDRPLSSARSLRNRGSTESLRPRNDDDAAPPQTPDPMADQAPQPITTTPPQMPNGTPYPNPAQSPSTPASDPWTGSSLMRHTSELVATAQRRARATVRKRQKTDSMISTEGATPKYRTRRMVKVYYDSYVQSFFEELVKFVSGQRNLMRKAKMAAKVAKIRQLAELEIPDGEVEGDVGGDGNTGGFPNPGSNLIAADPNIPTPDVRQGAAADMKLPQLSNRPYRGALMNPGMGFVPRRGMTSALNGRLGAFNERRDIWDEMDGGLEYVQGMCERAAHQFLRDGDCNEEVEKIKSRLTKVKDLAVNEKERISAEPSKDNIQSETNTGLEANQKTVAESGNDKLPEPEKDGMVPRVSPEGLLGAEPIKSRTFRPSTMRRDFGASTPSKIPAQHGVLEIDEGIEVDMDDFKPVHRSTRLMRRPV
ncbi:hypothetical protein F4861DRAFT_244616 [Xylaria intraflava]|nr:hypothetical protein F4861DRAFT_244616 [Xylaria intraflava]